MLDESQRGHLSFWTSEVVGLVIVVAALVVVVVLVEEDGEGEGEGEEGSKTPEMGRFRSRFRRPAAPPPNSSWIIFNFLDLKMEVKERKKQEKEMKTQQQSWICCTLWNENCEWERERETRAAFCCLNGFWQKNREIKNVKFNL